MTGSILARVLLFLLGGVFLFASTSVPSPAVLSLFFFLIGFSWSFFQLSSVAMISRLARPEYRGQALGLYNAVAGLGTVIAGVTSGVMAQHLGYGVTLIVAAILAAAAMVVVMRLRIPRRTAQPVAEPPRTEDAQSTKMHSQPASSKA